MARFGEEGFPTTDKEKTPDQTPYIDHGMRICQTCQAVIMEDQMASHRQLHSPQDVKFSVLLFRESDD